MALNDKAMLATLIIRQWTARKYDKKVSEEVEEKHNAKDAGRYNKLLISKEKLNKIQKVVTKLRTFHYKNTMAWGESGERLLPSKNYFDYRKELKALESEFNEAVREFVKDYPSLIEDARGRLGDMFEINDYPSEKEIPLKFEIKPFIQPVPEADFRVQLDSSEVQKLKTSMELEMAERLQHAMSDVWQRIAERLITMRDKLREKKEFVDDQGNKQIANGIFRNSLFENIQELMELVPKLNVTDDPKLMEICKDMEALVVDPDTIRSDDTLRSIKAQEVDNIMDKFKDFL